MCKEVNKDVQRPLREFLVLQGQIRVVDLKDCKKAAISSIMTASYANGCQARRGSSKN